MILLLEVMDKEPSLRTIWGAAVALGGAGYFLARVRRWFVLPVLAAIAIAAWAVFGELLDPQVGAGIVQEAGLWYVGQVCAAVALALILCLAGLAPKRAV
jgi:hypothetical protein